MINNKKHKLSFFCKTYKDDIEKFSHLYKTFIQHNKDNIHLYISVPKSDLSLFKKYNNKNISLISDESYALKYFAKEKYWGLSLGYINQEICKLSFWENNFCDNYLCIDSDAYFIRDFFFSDFMKDNRTPYSVLVMDKDLMTENFYHEFGKWRHDLIKKIFEYIKLDDKRYLTCHGMTILNCKVLENLKEILLKKNGILYADLINISPYEFTWYNAWLQKTRIIPIVNIEPFFKTFHMKIEYIFSKIKMISEKSISEQYVGIVLNSNWKNNKNHYEYGDIKWWHKFIYKFLEKR